MTKINDLISQLGRLGTEQINPNSVDIDLLTASEIATVINDEDHLVADIVKTAIPTIAETAETFAATIKTGACVFYVGAGTSGRLGVLDAAECPPTFGVEPGRVVGLIAGGYETLVLSAEGVEDNRQAAVDDLKDHYLSADDFVIGLAASTRTPYTLSALEFASAQGCKTALITCNRLEPKPNYLTHLIELPVGPEIITGSTRMKSGTAQKLTLNMISTTAMVLLGKTYRNLMVDLQAKSEKLAARSRKILMDLFELNYEAADKLLGEASGSVKLALTMKLLDCDAKTAEDKLAAADGFVRKTIPE